MKYIRAFIAFVIFAVVGALFGFALHWALNQVYPHGLRIDRWGIIVVLLFFSTFIFFTLQMIVDLVEAICKPFRRLGGPYRVVGMAAIAVYILYCLWSLHDLWVTHYKFHFTGMKDIEWPKFTMAVLLSIITIVAFGICITSAWGPKDMGKRQSS